jgi:predicted nucleotidyltransferase component of viral defense system
LPSQNSYDVISKGAGGMKREISNTGASIRVKLLNIAKKSNRDYNALLNQFFQERFLYKLSLSPYQNNFILKGALLLMTYDIEKTRPTKDIDFLEKSIKNDVESLKDIIQEICSIKTDDGIEFIKEKISAERIKEEAEYGGVRIHIPYQMHTIKGVIQIDVGFGDKIIKCPTKIEFPTLLDMPAPLINVYSLETAIAEKFEAIVKLNFQTSRMKDFFDIAHISTNSKFDSSILMEALIITFKTRGTNLEDRKTIFSEEYKTDNKKESQWKAFLNKNKILSDNNFVDIVNNIEKFIEPIFSNKKLKWNPQNFIWE